MGEGETVFEAARSRCASCEMPFLEPVPVVAPSELFAQWAATLETRDELIDQLIWRLYALWELSGYPGKLHEWCGISGEQLLAYLTYYTLDAWKEGTGRSVGLAEWLEVEPDVLIQYLGEEDEEGEYDAADPRS